VAYKTQRSLCQSEESVCLNMVMVNCSHENSEIDEFAKRLLYEELPPANIEPERSYGKENVIGSETGNSLSRDSAPNDA
jgi:hypothetical protein